MRDLPHRLVFARRSGLGHRRGMALVVVLAIVVLATVVVLAFFVHATANRKIEASRANRVQADQLARSAGDYVIARFLEEISDPTASTVFTVGGKPVFQPLSVTNAFPVRRVSSAITADDANFFNLIGQSVSGASVSGDGSALPSRDGRKISFARWNKPLLIGGNGFMATNQLPRWIYVDGRSGVTNAAGPGVIGRFAFNVYNVGGLFDANAAGHPAAAATGVATLKDTVAGADLTRLGLSQAEIDALVEFRNTSSAQNATNFSNWVNASAASGFLSNSVSFASGATTNRFTNSAFVSRQDLLRYVRTQSPGLTNALPLLTHFARSVNAPSWAPWADQTGYAYKSDANNSTSTNRFLANVRFDAARTVTHYADDGTASTRQVEEGDPLLSRRFSLAKLAWLTHRGPLSGISDAAIQACFGLRWDNAEKKWKYVGAIGTSLRTSLKTLDEVAQEGREPDFFELLQAGILSGSLAKCGYTSGSGRHGYSAGGIEGYERMPFLQLMRIGANIIDQYDSDSYPTAISIGDPAGYPLRICGIEDLPYFNKVIPIFYFPGAPSAYNPNHPADLSQPGPPPVYNYIAYELWNPHQHSASTVGPTRFRARVVPGAIYGLSYVRTVNGLDTSIFPLGGPSWDPSYQRPLDEAENAELIFTAGASDYREPALIRTGIAPRVTAGWDNTLDVLKLITVTDPAMVPDKRDSSGEFAFYNSAGMSIVRGVIALDYQDEDGVFRPYTTFLGQEEVPVSGWGGDVGGSPGLHISWGSQSGEKNSGVMWQGIGKIDPRTYRFDASFGLPPEVSNRPGNSPWEYGWSHNYPEFFSTAYTWGFSAPISLLARNKLAANPAYPESYPDRDDVTRPADGYHGDMNPFKENDSTARPVILNRPFRSAAELGYAFRDMPFKSLDFFTSHSADAALLDMFSVRDEPEVIAGRVDLNTPHSRVREALLSEGEGVTNAATTAEEYQDFSFSGGSAAVSTNAPLTVAGLANFAFSSDPEGNTAMLKKNSEAIPRILSASSQTRTWNFLIDVIAQAGISPQGGSGSQFIVEGEKRFWISVAIDRYTGEIVDEQWETVNE